MEKQELNEEQFLQVIDTYVDREILDIEYYMIASQTLVHKSTYIEDCNLKYVKDHNLLFKELPRAGGTIIAFAGDIELIYFLNRDDLVGMPPEIKNLIDMLLDKDIIPSIDNNDILIDGYKVASWSKQYFDDRILVVVGAFMNVDLDVIKHVCLKKMEKIPKGLSEFGITTEDVKKAFELV